VKIRTDFVTNSSSYSSAEIKINNPILLGILNKYKKMGMEYLFTINRSTFEYDGGDQADQFPPLYDAPTTIEGVLDQILDAINGRDEFGESVIENDDKIVSQLKNELEEKADEIAKAYKRIDWECSETKTGSDAEEYDDKARKMVYFNRILTGSKFTYSLKEGEKYTVTDEAESYDNNTGASEDDVKWNYELFAGCITITGNGGWRKDTLRIPSVLIGHRVTGIGDSVFYWGADEVTTVIIPEESRVSVIVHSKIVTI